jgi:hypothetical protein
MSDIDLIIQVHTEGIKQVSDLSASLRNLTTAINSVKVPASKLDDHTKALNRALNVSTKGVREHVTSLKELKQNQQVISAETRKLTGDIKAMQVAIKSGQNTNLINPGNLALLKGMQRNMKDLKLKAFSTDMQSIGLKMMKLGKDAQFVGRSLMINLTAPITLFARYGLSALRDIDKEATRLTKVLDGVAMNIQQAMAKTGLPETAPLVKKLVDNYNELNASLTETSATFGIAKSLTISLAADYAELGLSSTKAIASITKLTAQTEKLGGMDIGAAQDLIQAMYFQATRAFEMNGKTFATAADRQNAAVGAATAQLALFNAIENTTALTMRDIADAFPEVASMATTFGLSMTEAAAMLAPMKAAGLNVGASANSIKISLQKIIVPTQQNIKLFKSLASTYAKTAESQAAFNNISKSGLTGLTAVTEAFSLVEKSSAGLEGATQLMSKMFGVRQGPRMAIAIQQLAHFNDQLKTVNSQSPTTEAHLIDIANKASASSSLVIKDFAGIGVVARVATARVGQEVENFGKVTSKDIAEARKARSAVAQEILKANREGRDIMSEISTEAGRAMIVELGGAESATAVANQELKASLGTLDTAISRIKNNFKIFAADIINSMRPAIEKIAEITGKLIDKWNKLSAGTKKAIGTMIMSFLGFLAVLGPIVLLFGTFSSVTGILTKNFFKLIPGLKAGEGAFQNLGTAAQAALNKIKGLNTTYSDFLTKQGLFNMEEITTKGAAVKTGISGMSAEATSAAKFSKLVTKPAAPVFPTMGKVGIPSVTAKMIDAERADIARSMGFLNKDIDAAIKATRNPKLIDSLGKKAKAVYDLTNKSVFQPAVPEVGVPEISVPAGPLNAAKVKSELQKKLYAEAKALEASLHATKIADITSEYEAQKAAYELSRADLKARGDAAKAAYKSSTFGPPKPAKPFSAMEEAWAKSKRRGKLFEEAGVGKRILRPMPGTPFGLEVQRTFRGMDITNAEAVKIAKGGMGARIQKAKTMFAIAGEKTGLRPSQFLKTTPGNARELGGLAKGGVKKAFRSAMDSDPMMGAKLGVRQLKKDFMDLDGSAPGTFKKISAAVKGFASESGAATKAIKLMKYAFAGIGIGAVILAIAVAVKIVIDNFDAFKKTGQNGLFAIQRVLKILKDTLGELIRPVVDLFSAFGSGGKEGAGAAEGIGKAFTFLMKIVQKVASFIKSIVVGVIQPALYFIVNIIASVVELFQGHWGKAVGFLVSALAWAGKLMVNIIAGVLKGMVSIIFMGVKAGLTYFTLWPKMLAKLFGFLSKIPGIGGAFKIASDGINGIVDGMFGMVDKAHGAVNGLIDGAAKGVNSLLDKGTKLGVGKSMGNAFAKAKPQVKKDAGELGTTAGEEISNKMGDGLGNVANKAGSAAKNAVKTLVQEINKEVLDIVKSKMDEAVGKLTDAMKKQKEDSLKVFDQQIETIDKLKKAEETLTKKKEYELNRRDLLDQRELQKANYVRNRALAIYEGRIDDARMLELQQAKDTKDSDKSLTQLDASRNADLAQQNLDSTKGAIEESKKAAADYFDNVVQKFEDATKLITKFPPTSREEFQAQLDQLNDIATKSSTDMGTTFTTMLNDLGNNIRSRMQNSPTGAAGIFSEKLDDLIKVAREQFGLGSSGGDDKTVIGATIAMLGDIESSIKGSTFGEEFASITDGMIISVEALGTNIKNPVIVAMTSISDTIMANNPADVWAKAIDEALDRITQKYKEEAFVLNNLIDESSTKFTKLKQIYLDYKAAADAAAGAGQGAAGGGDTPPPPTDVPKTAYFYRTEQTMAQYIPKLASVGPGAKKYYGGMIPTFASGGYLNAAMSKAIPALLHGGEYIVNAKAVQNIGAATLQNLNDMRFRTPSSSRPSGMQNSSMSTQNTNIYVDNFIGEEEWFCSMMKEYNINVLPRQQKAAGVQSRVVRSYNGINQGY